MNNEQYLDDYLSQYVKFKTQFTVEQRISHRDQFIAVAKRCLASNISSPFIIDRLEKLVENAYKTAERNFKSSV